jgi:hypothetical protein
MGLFDWSITTKKLFKLWTLLKKNVFVGLLIWPICVSKKSWTFGKGLCDQMCGYWEQYGGCMRIVGTQWGTFGKTYGS